MKEEIINQPFISVIIPVYNTEKYIKRCIESVLRQSYNNFELILIDDGSTDNSLDICKQYKSDKTHIISNKNQGVSITRNIGIEHAKGDFITFIDSDDWVLPNYLENFLINGYAPSKSLTIQGVQRIYKKRNIKDCIYPNIILNNKQEISKAICEYKLFHNGYPVAKLFDANIIKQYRIHFEEGLQTHEDHLFVFKYYLRINKIVLKNSFEYQYMIEQESNTLSKKIYKPEILLKASDLFFKSYTDLLNIYNIKHTNYYKRLVTDFGLTQRIKAILNLYYWDYKKDIRYNYLRQEFKQNKKLYSSYKSKYIYRNTIAKLLLITPIPILDITFRFIIKKNKS